LTVCLIVSGLLFASCGDDDEDSPPDNPGPSLEGELLINEFLAINDTTLADEFGEFDDWIELWNRGPGEASTAGFYLTDDLGRPMRWALPDTSLLEGGFLLVWADADADSGQAPWHTTFRLSGSGGEEVGLFRLEGGGTALVDSVTFGIQLTGVSLARDPDGGETWVPDSSPTPEASNE
jgi:hypothetical protein